MTTKITLSEEQLRLINSVKSDTINNTSKSNKADYPDPVNGDYITSLCKVELIFEKGTPKFHLEFALLEGCEEATDEYIRSWPGKNHPKIPFKMSLAGTKNDLRCIGYCLGLASRLHPHIDIDFNGDFQKLAEDLNHLNNSIVDDFGYAITYDKDNFRHLRINEILRPDNGNSESQETDGGINAPAPQDGCCEKPHAANDAQAQILAIQQPTSLPIPEDEVPKFDSNGFLPIEDDEEYLPF